MNVGPLVFRVHAIKRMFQRRISKNDVRHVLETGETIETYPDDTPYPSRLILGWWNARPLHVVAAENAETRETIVITAYEPDPEEWERGFKRRKRR
ncbi:MAG TPA: DUF4258 domain-containing protein [Verrucomicrobiae bacterium]|nr:DUF4258 domain-containing protein [Verrucomicrobiae bacterium]